jgi:radical SAM superfamily enzyme YgiQ (UPF0313 family)
MKFVLINPTSPDWRVTQGTVPRKRTRMFRFSMLSSLYVAASIPPPFQTVIVDEEVESFDFDMEADLFGISFMTYNAPRAYEIADELRSRGKTVIVGGYHPTLLPEESAAHADAVCIGEAETSVPRMIADFRAGALQGFYHGGLADLRTLQNPDRRLIQRGLYAPVTAVQATRGCPNACRFCSISSFFDHRFRTRPVESVVAEIKLLGTHILFMDDNLTANPDYAEELFARMIPLNKRWYSQCSVSIAYNDKLLEVAARSGCRGLFLGLESLSEKNLNGWSKGANNARDYEWVIRKIHAAGIGTIAGIVFGYDWDTTKVFPETLDFLLRNNVDALQATILTPFPGTPLHEEMKVQRRLTDNNWAHYDFRHVVFDPAHMSPGDLRRGHDWVLSRFYSRGAVARRIAREFGYLQLGTILTATVPLNMAYRSRLTTDGTIQPGFN